MKDDLIIVGTLPDPDVLDFGNTAQYIRLNRLRQERLELAIAIETEGFSVTRTTRDWPRDDFVKKGSKVVDNFRYGPRFSEGGNILATRDFILASDYISEGVGGRNYAKKKLKDIYGAHPYFLPPALLHVNGDDNRHIDLSLLPIEQLRMLLVDEKYYSLHHALVDEVAGKEDYSIKQVVDNYSGQREWPCNSLVLEKEPSEIIVFTNKGNNGSPLCDIGENVGFRVIEIPFMNNASENGSTKCATNVLPISYISHGLFQLYSTILADHAA